MRVPDRYGPWVVDLIGQDRAAGCRSLPKRFRAGRLATALDANLFAAQMAHLMVLYERHFSTCNRIMPGSLF